MAIAMAPIPSWKPHQPYRCVEWSGGDPRRRSPAQCGNMKPKLVIFQSGTPLVPILMKSSGNYAEDISAVGHDNLTRPFTRNPDILQPLTALHLRPVASPMQFKLQILTIAVLGFTTLLAAAVPVPLMNPPLNVEVRKSGNAEVRGCNMFVCIGSCTR
ncbi:hypothetical protein FB451DRAFT_1371717 [Mycena latifolia]|nr:hypothetical protein FB451DRAFT_1371717 [Mycena latifolia]